MPVQQPGLVPVADDSARPVLGQHTGDQHAECRAKNDPSWNAWGFDAGDGESVVENVAVKVPETIPVGKHDGLGGDTGDTCEYRDDPDSDAIRTVGGRRSRLRCSDAAIPTPKCRSVMPLCVSNYLLSINFLRWNSDISLFSDQPFIIPWNMIYDE